MSRFKAVGERMGGATIVLALLCGALGSWRAHAGGTLTWIESPSDMARGRVEDMALSRSGRLFLAPRVARIGGDGSPARPRQVWALASDSLGNIFLGTGPDGQVLRIGRSDRTAELFTADEPLVSALAVTAEGRLVAGSSPGGSIYRIARDGSGELWAELEERYVWALAPGADGSIYAGTGERGRIVKINPSGSTELVFDSDESHIVSLLALPDGGLLAGGGGRGLVYRIDEEGHALVLHDDDLPEVASLGLEPGGSVLAAFLAPPQPASRPPALHLRLPDGVQVGTTDETVGMLEEASGPTLRGYIEGLVPEAAREAERARGRVVRIDVTGVSQELWSSASEVPFCLALDPVGRVLFGTGEPARLYRVDTSGDVALLATLEQAQITALSKVGPSIVLATSNPAATYRLEDDPSESGVYVSRPFDAGGPSRWGSIRWKVENPSGRIEVYTRTGNSREPDATWSAWSPALTDPGGSAVVNPDGRFLQWRLRQVGSRPETRLSEVAVQYEPYNRPPSLREFRVEAPGSETSGSMKFRWSARDPDDDRVGVTLEYRVAGEEGWAVGGVYAPPPTPRTTGRERVGWHDGELEWSTGALTEGEYEVRAVASDQPDNAAGEGLEATPLPVLRVVVDRTPPEIDIQARTDRTVEVVLADAHSNVRRLEWVLDGRVRFTSRPEDGLCDSRREVFRVELPGGDPSGWRLRGVDAAENSVERPLEGTEPSSF